MNVVTRTVVELDSDAVEKVFFTYLLGLHQDAYFKGKDKLYKDEDMYHGSPLTTRVDRPTEVQLAAVRLRDALQKAGKRGP